MNFEETYEAVRSGVAAAMERPTSRSMMRIAEFDAVDDEANPVRVVGIVDDDEDEFHFVVIVEVDGEIFPSVRASVHRPPQ